MSAPSRDLSGLALVALAAGVMWLFEIADQLTGEHLDQYGIEPRDTDGLAGILAAPFLHGGFDHLIGNTIPFLALGAAIALAGAARVAAVAAIVAVIGGLGTWLVAPAGTIHIGASGIVFGFAAYLAVRGIYTRRVVDVVLGLVVLGIWGTTLLQGLVPEEGISWQGHLFGAIGGIVAAWALHGRGGRATPAARSARRRSA